MSGDDGVGDDDVVLRGSQLDVADDVHAVGLVSGVQGVDERVDGFERGGHVDGVGEDEDGALAVVRVHGGAVEHACVQGVQLHDAGVFHLAEEVFLDLEVADDRDDHFRHGERLAVQVLAVDEVLDEAFAFILVHGSGAGDDVGGQILLVEEVDVVLAIALTHETGESEGVEEEFLRHAVVHVFERELLHFFTEEREGPGELRGRGLAEIFGAGGIDRFRGFDHLVEETREELGGFLLDGVRDHERVVGGILMNVAIEFCEHRTERVLVEREDHEVGRGIEDGLFLVGGRGGSRGCCGRILVFGIVLDVVLVGLSLGFGFRLRDERRIDGKLGVQFDGRGDVLEELEEGGPVGLAEMTINQNVLFVQGVGIDVDHLFALFHAVRLARHIDGVKRIAVGFDVGHGLADHLALVPDHEDQEDTADKRQDQDGRENDIFQDKLFHWACSVALAGENFLVSSFSSSGESTGSLSSTARRNLLMERWSQMSRPSS